MAQTSSFGTDLGDATREPASSAFKVPGPFCDCTGEMVNGWRTKGSACGAIGADGASSPCEVLAHSAAVAIAVRFSAKFWSAKSGRTAAGVMNSAHGGEYRVQAE
jgi:hypothetical protein